VQLVVRHPVALLAASRTDAGVHARGQVVNFLTNSSIDTPRITAAISHRLPEDIALVRATEVPPEFHATRAARGKLYRYRVHAQAWRPVETGATRMAWHVWFPLDVEKMRLAAAQLIGTHDFAAFATAGCQRQTTVRTIRHLEVRRRFEQIQFDVEGDGFLYNQVRNMVGTLTEVGRGHWPVACIPEILESRSRARAGPTAPAYGLCLEWVRYGPTRSTTDGA